MRVSNERIQKLESKVETMAELMEEWEQEWRAEREELKQLKKFYLRRT